MTDVGELVVRIRADSAELERAMRSASGAVQQNAGKMESSLSNLKNQLLALAPALSVVAVTSFGRAAFAEADHINDLAQRTGFLGSTLSALNIPLRQSGSGVDEFAGSLVRMNNAIGEAAKGGQDQVKAFDQMGLSVRKLQQLSPEDQFNAIADALSGIKSQSEFTNLGISIFGRSFATIAPLIRQAAGDMKGLTDSIKANGDALSDEDLARIDEMGDKWTAAVEQMKLAILNSGIISYLEAFAAGVNAISDGIKSIPNLAALTVPGTHSGATGPAPFSKEDFDEMGISFSGSNSAKGGNAGLLKDDGAKKIADAKKALEDYNTQLAHEHEFAGMAPADAAAKKAYYETLERAQQAGIKDAELLAAANSEVARSTYEMAQKQQEAARFSAELKDSFASAAGDMIFQSKSAKDAVRGLAEELAKMLAKRYLLGPLADGLFGSPGGGGGLFGSMFGGFFAEGGSPPVGIPSIVGENGPELFVPNSGGTIIPNNKLGGAMVSQTLVFNMSPGLPETVFAAIQNAAPYIAAQAHASVFKAIQGGGSESRIVGRRS
jgi:hypothetical protein